QDKFKGSITLTTSLVLLFVSSNPTQGLSLCYCLTREYVKVLLCYLTMGTLLYVNQVYGSFSVGEIFADKFISWFPLYYHMKLAFLVWLQLPTTNVSNPLLNVGAKQLYTNYLRPFFLRHQARLDQVTGLFYSEAGKFISAHQGEFQFMKTLVMKIVMSVKQFVNGSDQPATREERRSTTGPREQAESSVSEDGDHDDDSNDNDEDDEYVSVPPPS
ncbi:HVA22-like protein k, partial [Tanacetum coccineum]